MYTEHEEPAETTDEERAEFANYVAHNTKDRGACVKCKQPFVFYQHHTAIAQGHVYSQPGLAEIAITGLCEFCFDGITLPVVADPCDCEDCVEERKLSNELGLED